MRLLVAGDIHGNRRHLDYIFKMAIEQKVDAIVQVGDFGYWPHKNGGAYLDDVIWHSVASGIKFYWLDGNHENFDALEKVVDMKADVPQVMGSNAHGQPFVYYLPRGVVWEWDSIKFMAMGGAFSIDKDWRIVGDSWWPQELITAYDVELAETRGKVDVMFTHDAPEGACPIVRDGHDRLEYRGSGWGYKNDQVSKSNRAMLDHVIRSADPTLLVHGHYHHRYTKKMTVNGYGRLLSRPLVVEGLGCDGHDVGSWLVLNTDNIKGGG